MREFFFLSITLSFYFGIAQIKSFSHYDSIHGGMNAERIWWNVLYYDLHVKFNSQQKSISGHNKISYQVLTPNHTLQLDLKAPLILDSVIQNSKKCVWRKDSNAYFVHLETEQKQGHINQLTAYYHGKPIKAKNPPWDGGLVWRTDKNKNEWISIACQGLAASVWFPCKDHMYDEADSVSLNINCPKNLVAVSNGKLRSIALNKDSSQTYNWTVTNPINNYNIIPYIGKYVNFSDTFIGESGILKLNYWVLDYNLEKAKSQFKQVKPMLRCFEYWFGKYPFYEDGYKLVESPYLGMEHQSAIAYGNNYINGYNGRDLSQTGWGLKWDFIIIHESGHEWFGNNISVKDVADNWVHEGFTNYAENLFTEFLYGKNAGAEYVIGTRSAILNDRPIIGDYGVNSEGSGDMYYKAANMLHTIRQIVNNDSLWRAFLREVNQKFWHQTVTSNEIESFMISFLKINLAKIFDQYLRTIQIPIFEYEIKKNVLKYKWTNCIEGFNMPIKIKSNNTEINIIPSTMVQKLELQSSEIEIDKNYFVNLRRKNK